MITKELNKPTTSIVDRILQNYHHIQQHPNHKVTPLHVPLHKTWTKLQYTMWIEKIKEQFKKGDIVTLVQIPIIAGKAPFQYLIEDIQELHYQAEIDTTSNQPKALALRIVMVDGSMDKHIIWRPPIGLRHLDKTELKQEIKYVNNSVGQEEFPDPDGDTSGILRLAYLRE